MGLSHLSVAHPFYMHHSIFSIHLNQWESISDTLKDKLYFSVVDDGSPDPIRPPKKCSLNLSIYRIDKDIPWNNAGADNLCLHVARKGWVLRADFDYVLNRTAAEILFSLENLFNDPSTMYRFYVNSDRGILPSKCCNLYIIDKGTFWRSGGYDEDFSGHYGSADTFWCKDSIKPFISSIVLLPPKAHLDFLEYGGSGVPKTGRAVNRDLYVKKRSGKTPRSEDTLRFKWEKVYENKRSDLF